MDYVNTPDASPRSRSERKLNRRLLVSFGLLCVLQAALNISLRLVLHGADSETAVVGTNLTDVLKGINLDPYFQEGWVYFRLSLYYVSSVKKTWQDSRDDCLQRGADLVIIDSKEEQDLTRKFQRFTWIGLRDRKIKGMWTWVDGTPLTKSYWGPGEPNKGKREDCAEIRLEGTENNWNDIACDVKNFWICERRVAP